MSTFANPMRTPEANGEMAQYGDDKSLWVEFYSEPILQEFESKKAGKQVWKEETFVHIMTPGAKSDIRRKVKLTAEEAMPAPPDNERFPRQWTAFQNQQTQAPDGLPIEQWPPLNKSQVFDMKANRILSVEQLAALSDIAIQVLGMDGRRLRDLAKAYVEKSGEGAALSAALAREAVLKADIEALKQQFADIAAQQTSNRGKGRSSKEENNAD